MLYVVCSNNRTRCLKVTDEVWNKIQLLHALGLTKLSGFNAPFTKSISKYQHSIRNDGQRGNMKFRVTYKGRGNWYLKTWELE